MDFTHFYSYLHCQKSKALMNSLTKLGQWPLALAQFSSMRSWDENWVTGERLGSCPKLSTVGLMTNQMGTPHFSRPFYTELNSRYQQFHFSQEDVIAGCFGASFFSKSSGIGTTLPQDSAASKWICQVSIPWRCHVTGDVPYGSDIVLWIQCRSRHICGYTDILVGGLEHEFYFSIYWE